MSVLSIDIPVIATPRLILRAPVLDDLAPLTAFFATSDSHFVGGPMAANDTQRAMFSTFGSWALHGFGLWHVAETVTDRFVGWTGLLLTAGKPEPGFAWTILPAFRGKGLATEAARAALDHVRVRMNRNTPASYPASYIEEDNTASRRIADKLGFGLEATDGSELTFRHAPEARA